MYSLKYNESISTKQHEIYTFINTKHACTVVTAKLFIPIELIIYHDRKEFAIYHMYEVDKDIMNDLFECIDDNLEFLGANKYIPQEITYGNACFIEYMMKEHGPNENN